jgi:hypothetical protein
MPTRDHRGEVRVRARLQSCRISTTKQMCHPERSAATELSSGRRNNRRAVEEPGLSEVEWHPPKGIGRASGRKRSKAERPFDGCFPVPCLLSTNANSRSRSPQRGSCQGTTPKTQRRPGSPHSKKQTPLPLERQRNSIQSSPQSTPEPPRSICYGPVCYLPYF